MKIFGAGKPIIAGIIVFAVALTLTQVLVFQRYQILRSTEEQELNDHATWTKERLQTVFSYSFSTTHTLEFIVKQYGVPSNFDSVANELLKLNPYADAVQLVKGGVITNVYPLAGNEASLGIDILADPVRRSGAMAAIKRREFFVAGPLHLVQGGEGFVARLPVFMEDKFWGFSAVIIRLSTLLNAAHIDTTAHGHYSYQLSYINPDTGK